MWLVLPWVPGSEISGDGPSLLAPMLTWEPSVRHLQLPQCWPVGTPGYLGWSAHSPWTLDFSVTSGLLPGTLGAQGRAKSRHEQIRHLQFVLSLVLSESSRRLPEVLALGSD